MFRLAILLFVLALLAAIVGAGGIAGILFEGAELFLIVGVVLLVIGLIFGRGRLFN